MVPATTHRSADAFSALLAGLQAGMLGALWMLAWLGVSDVWKLRSFWTSENLMASVFYGSGAIRRGFASATLSGLALDLLLYSLLGAALALALRDRFPPLRTALLCMLFGLGWYYFSFHLVWKAAGPLVALLHAERPTLIGHAIYGACLARFPHYLPRAAAAPNEAAVPEGPAAEQVVPEAAGPEAPASMPAAPETHPDAPGQ